MNDQLEHAPLGVLEVTEDGRVAAANQAVRELIEIESEPTGQAIDDVFPRSVEDTIVEAFQDEPIEDLAVEEYYPPLDQWLSVSVVPTDGGGVVYVQDVTVRQQYEQSIERLRAEQNRTALIDDVLSGILADLVEASSRDEIAETICRTLGTTDLYEFAWVGEREIGGDDIVVRSVAGDTGDTFEAIREALDETVTTPEERAVERGCLQSVQPLADGADVPEAVRRAGFADGVQSVLAIPLVYGSNVHGVVGVYASGMDAFSTRERTSFQTLGEVAGFAITAARNRNLLLSDGVTEVTFEVGPDSVLAALSGMLDTAFELEGVVPHEDDAVLCFVGIEGIEAAAVAEAATDMAAIGNVRMIQNSESGGTVEIEVRGSEPLLEVSLLGGTIRRASFEDGAGDLVVDLPRDSDVRRIVDVVSREYDADVVAKRERERPVTTAREFHDDLDDRLTQRQQTVLRTAYHADYFESPRGSTAEEVATSLDITGSTLLHHLRAGQRKLLAAYLDVATDASE